VIERAMCESPKTRSTWASINQAVANVDLSKAAFWPSVQGDVRYLYQHNRTQTESADLESNYAKGVNEETLTLSWVLYDFGARVSSLDNGRALLAAAEANQNATLQEVFRHAAQDYFNAQAAQATVISKRTIEQGAQQNLDAARTRVTRGVAPVTDELQAKTAAAQATFERVKAEGGLRAALGALAVDMSLSPDEDLVLPEMEQGALPNEDFVKRVHDLLEDARRNHPKILAAAAEWQSALANCSGPQT
jgi:outer membrane protein